ncbi:MAG: hypothetical protein JNK02_12960 [Planctomycetes bacterium]|nr:hypothetical protein [Planctomycetota bacterium]
MRVPVASAVLCAGILTYGAGPGDGAALGPAPLLVLERSDAAARADGLVARRLAVYPDGLVLAVEPDGTLPRGQLRPAALADLLAQVEAAHLDELPAILAARIDWFDVGDAWCVLQGSAPAGPTVRVDGDLRPGSRDRALAPHGFVEILERLESVELSVVDGAPTATRVGFRLEPWTPRALSPFAGVDELEPLPFPSGAEAPEAREFQAEGELAQRLLEVARAGRALRWSGRDWRILATPRFPREADERTAAGANAHPRRG